ncbi:hypothetical protein E2C01_005049 [Portunus trituberculatus]|uniref:Uncharacterized protein n=1 Tax=Portunus trituberculatus TaxID=210409 RepID=A0A5B7CTZ8_PORTR|nr:hypothetical protein [Portunus trituberculatus]
MARRQLALVRVARSQINIYAFLTPGSTPDSTCVTGNHCLAPLPHDSLDALPALPLAPASILEQLAARQQVMDYDSDENEMLESGVVDVGEKGGLSSCGYW